MRVVYDGGERSRPYVSRMQPGTVTEAWEERPGKWWIRAEFVVEHWAPAEEWEEYCETCKNRGGWWECPIRGRQCNECRCEADHVRVWCPADCVVARLDREELSHD